MFPRGPRFEPSKVSDVPGPNSYNTALDSQADHYKRGAFLDKTDRFSKEKESDVPGPGTYDSATMKPIPNNPKSRVPSQNLADRYAVLQRKVEDLERVHHDGKKSHQHEIDRLKLELARSQKSNAEQAERLEKQKKQIELLDARMLELKKAASSDQAEIKDLRVKLRMSEHERTQMAGKQGEASELKKSLQALEAKRRDEIKERDRKILELEKAATVEKKRREVAEQTKLKGDEELQAARAATLQSEIVAGTAQTDVQHLRDALSTLKDDSSTKEESFLAQLEQHRCLLAQVAEEYGRLAIMSVPKSDHMHLKHHHAALQMHVSRLERKLANSEGQVVELANLIRQTMEQSAHLKQRLWEAEQEILLYIQASSDVHDTSPVELETSFSSILDDISMEGLNSENEVRSVNQKTSELICEFYRLTSEELLLVYSITDQQLVAEQSNAQQYATDLTSALASHEAIATCLESAKKERSAVEGELRAATATTDKLKTSSEYLTRQVAEIEERMREATRVHDATSKKDRESAQRLNVTVQKCRMVEDALRAEIDQLTTELTDAERYQEAYYSLSDEVGSLLTRNQLAEDEAHRLSKFNAEILGHNNPAQRIMYVDRIRRELAETKHKLAMLSREKETVVAENVDLQHELDMYKSVMVPPDQKPRTTITRVGRPPLVSLSHSLNTGNHGHPQASNEKYVDVLETIPGDMTLDEIMC